MITNGKKCFLFQHQNILNMLMMNYMIIYVWWGEGRKIFFNVNNEKLWNQFIQVPYGKIQMNIARVIVNFVDKIFVQSAILDK